MSRSAQAVSRIPRRHKRATLRKITAPNGGYVRLSTIGGSHVK